MLYREFPPIPPLARFVRCIWTMQSPVVPDSEPPERLLPDGLSEIVINRAAKFRELRADGSSIIQPDTLIAGQLSRPLLIQPTDEIDLIGIRFQPAGLHAFLRVPMHEVTNQRIGLSELSTRIACDLKTAAHGPSPVELVQRVVMNAIDANRMTETGDVMRAVGLIRRSTGRHSIPRISDSIGISPRQLLRRFNDEVGVSTKTYARIVRFDGLVRALRAGLAEPWTQIALGFGFHDQAHLIREFRMMAGQSPTEFAASQHVMTDHFTASANVSDFYNTA